MFSVNRCMRMTSINGQTMLIEEVQEFFSTHEKADVKIILNCFHVAASTANDATICVRSPDTDVLVLLFKFSQDIL